MVDATLFISIMIIALVEMLKMAIPNIQGWVTIIIAFCVGIAVALLAPVIGVGAISIAQGLLAALGAIGITATAKKAGSGN